MRKLQTQNKAFNSGIKKIISNVVIPFMLATTLGACNTQTAIGITQTQTYQFVHTIKLEPGFTSEALAAAYEGEIIVWQPEDGFAIVASNLQTPVASRNTRGLETLFTSIAGAINSVITTPTTSTTTTTALTTTQPNSGLVAIAEGRKMAYASGRKMAYASGALANLMIGSMSQWKTFFCVGWCGTTTNIGFGTVSLQNLIAFIGAQGDGGIRLSGAQKLTPKLGGGIKVAIIDTGVDLQHPGLKGVASDATQPKHLAPSTDWYDFVDKDATPQEVAGANTDGYGHGTGVAGAVLQIAPKAIIMPIRVLGSDGSGDVSALSSAIQWAVNHGAKIINLSLGTAERVEAVSSMVQWATSKGVYVVVASGNTNDSQITYPAADALDKTRGGAKMISVGSVGSGNILGAYLGGTTATAAAAGQKSEFSTFGPNVEMMAPGELISTLLPESQTGDWTGTSFAAPMVSGALALALAEPLTTSQKELVASAITSSANNLDACNPQFVGQLGSGRLDVEAFVRKVLGKPASPVASCK